MKTGILLVNLGTPDSPSNWDVFKYLNEFLTDERVIDIPWLARQFLVRGVIVPKRFRQSASSYRQIWTPEGSPLLVYGKRTVQLLQQALGPEYAVELAMRYQNPSIKQGLKKLLAQPLKKLIVLPLFPQYASATTGSVHQKVMEELKHYLTIPEVTFINSFADFPPFIDAFCATVKNLDLSSYDHVLFSFHGLPERQLIKANPSCLKNCCQKSCTQTCYAAQCNATMNAIAAQLKLPHYSICFQSRLGKEPWIPPFTSEVIHDLAKSGKKRVLVFCPSFVCDCLETLFEIGVEYAEEFKAAGGETLDLAPGLNDSPGWITSLCKLFK